MKISKDEEVVTASSIDIVEQDNKEGMHEQVNNHSQISHSGSSSTDEENGTWEEVIVLDEEDDNTVDTPIVYESICHII